MAIFWPSRVIYLNYVFCFSLHREGTGPSTAVRGLKWEPCKLHGLCLPTALRLHTSLWASRKLILCRHCHHMKLHLTCNRVPEPVSHWLDKQVVPPSNSHHWMSQCRDRLTKMKTFTHSHAISNLYDVLSNTKENILKNVSALFADLNASEIHWKKKNFNHFWKYLLLRKNIIQVWNDIHLCKISLNHNAHHSLNSPPQTTPNYLRLKEMNMHFIWADGVFVHA